MKTEEDEAFDELARRQGMWGGGYQAKRQMAADKQEPWNEDEWRRNNWRCGHGWLRGEQCEICNSPKQHMAADKLWDRPSVAFDEWWNGDNDESTNPFRLESGAYWAWAGWKAALAQPAQEPVAHILQFIKELRPAIGPMAGMGKSKTTQEWFDIVINEIERLQTTR